MNAVGLNVLVDPYLIPLGEELTISRNVQIQNGSEETPNVIIQSNNISI